MLKEACDIGSTWTSHVGMDEAAKDFYRLEHLSGLARQYL